MKWYAGLLLSVITTLVVGRASESPAPARNWWLVFSPLLCMAVITVVWVLTRWVFDPFWLLYPVMMLVSLFVQFVAMISFPLAVLVSMREFFGAADE